uniref:Deltameth_res domain-containing protein n=2 Tax=Schistosoma mansoni TaxID=6183 RepID=A0A3Q0KBU2_SCHMA
MSTTRILSAHHSLSRTYSSTVPEVKNDKLQNEQIRYSTHKKWHAVMTYIPKPRDIPDYQYPILLMCSLIIATYFCFIHTRCDLDDILDENFKAFEKNKLGKK